MEQNISELLQKYFVTFLYLSFYSCILYLSFYSTYVAKTFWTLKLILRSILVTQNKVVDLASIFGGISDRHVECSQLNGDYNIII